MQHIMIHHSQNDNTYEQIIKQTHTTTFKLKFPNHPFPTKPGTAREYSNHPEHTNTKSFLEITLPSFPQCTLNTPTIAYETRNFDDEHVLMPTFHWTAYYNYTNPLCLPLANTTENIEKKIYYIDSPHH